MVRGGGLFTEWHPWVGKNVEVTIIKVYVVFVRCVGCVLTDIVLIGHGNVVYCRHNL